MRTRRAIRRFIEERLLEGLAASPDPVGDGLLDSLAMEQLVEFIEETYGIRLTTTDLRAEDVTSLDELVALVDRKRGRRS
jgi:acyl carrier protein